MFATIARPRPLPRRGRGSVVNGASAESRRISGTAHVTVRISEDHGESRPHHSARGNSMRVVFPASTRLISAISEPSPSRAAFTRMVTCRYVHSDLGLTESGLADNHSRARLARRLGRDGADRDGRCPPPPQGLKVPRAPLLPRAGYSRRSPDPGLSPRRPGFVVHLARRLNVVLLNIVNISIQRVRSRAPLCSGMHENFACRNGFCSRCFATCARRFLQDPPRRANQRRH